MNLIGLGHINVVVDNMDSAISYYTGLFNAAPVQSFPHFKNKGFAQSAGFVDKPEQVDVSITFLELKGANIFLELMEYHTPKGDVVTRHNKKANDIGGIGHICIKVNGIDELFEHVKKQHDTQLITDHPDYQPFQISPIESKDFFFYDEAVEQDSNEKNNVCDIIAGISYFYFIDKYGIQWEFEQGHTDIGE